MCRDIKVRTSGMTIAETMGWHPTGKTNRHISQVARRTLWHTSTVTRHLKWHAGLKWMLGITRASTDRVVGGAVSPTAEMTHMGMTIMEGMSNQTMGIVEVVHLLATGMAHFWEEEDYHLMGHQAHLEVPFLTWAPIRVTPITWARLAIGVRIIIIIGNTPTTSGDIPQETIDTLS